MPGLVPDPRHWKQARQMVAAAHHRGAEGVDDLLYVADPDEVPLVVYCLTRMALAGDAEPIPVARIGRGRPEVPVSRSFSYEEATAAHRARARGDESTWAREGNRVYMRLRKRAQRQAAAS